MTKKRKPEELLTALAPNLKRIKETEKIIKKISILKQFSAFDTNNLVIMLPFLEQEYFNKIKKVCEENNLEDLEKSLENDQLITQNILNDTLKQINYILIIDELTEELEKNHQIISGFLKMRDVRLIDIKNCNFDLTIYFSSPVSKKTVFLDFSNNVISWFSKISYLVDDNFSETASIHQTVLHVKNNLYKEFLKIAKLPAWKHNLLFADLTEIILTNFLKENLSGFTYLFSKAKCLKLEKLFYEKSDNLLAEFQIFADKFLKPGLIKNITVKDCKTLIHIANSLDSIKFLHKIGQIVLPFRIVNGEELQYSISDVQNILNIYLFQRMGLYKNHNILDTLPKWQIVTLDGKQDFQFLDEDADNSAFRLTLPSINIAKEIYKYLPQYCENDWNIENLGDNHIQEHFDI